MKNLYEQCNPTTLSCASMLACGVTEPPAQFNNTLREIPALAEGFTIGDVARAYLAATLAQLQQIKAERMVEEHRTKYPDLTKTWKEA